MSEDVKHEHPLSECERLGCPPVQAGGWRCDCGTFTQVSHQSTFCKVTGESDVTVHWCCPGACELGATRPPPRMAERELPEAPADLTRGATKLWFYEGAVLEATDGRGGVSAHDLLEFAQFAQKHYPDERVMLHAFGLRVTKTAGESGPRLEWRDWD